MTIKPEKTAADYLAIAICPPLIMVLVGSLVFFLLQVGYAGEWLGRLRWTLFWFVFAMVLVSRIAIQQSMHAAFLYGLALAAATSLLLTQYVGFIWGVWLLLGLIWWAANQITWDCTLIDDDQDASGQGLLRASQVENWLRRQKAAVHAVPSDEPLPGNADRSGAFGAGLPSFPSVPRARNLNPAKRLSPQAQRRLARRAEKKQQVHAPGVWVLYFSLAAVPVFGLGELLFARDDTAGRRIGFVLLLAYLAAGFSLLVITSFLGLRRYLRQHQLRMPATIVLGWVRGGISLVVVTLALALLLPKPAAPYSIAALVTKIASRELSDSSRAKRSGNDSNQRSSEESTGQRRDQTAEGRAGEEQQPGRTPQSGGTKSQAGARSESGAPKGTSRPEMPGRLPRGLSVIVTAVLIVLLLVWYRAELSSVLRLVLAGLSNWWRDWFAGSRNRRTRSARKAHLSHEEGAVLPPDPFRSGRAEKLSLAELVRYSFEAVKAWGQKRGFVAQESQTPLEFAELLAQREPVLRNELLLLSSYYSNLAYGDQAPPEDAMVILRRLWMVMNVHDPQKL